MNPRPIRRSRVRPESSAPSVLARPGPATRPLVTPHTRARPIDRSDPCHDRSASVRDRSGASLVVRASGVSPTPTSASGTATRRQDTRGDDDRNPACYTDTDPSFGMRWRRSDDQFTNTRAKRARTARNALGLTLVFAGTVLILGVANELTGGVLVDQASELLFN
jgi:hypothetical protein